MTFRIIPSIDVPKKKKKKKEKEKREEKEKEKQNMIKRIILLKTCS
jgi:hypothetical protein